MSQALMLMGARQLALRSVDDQPLGPRDVRLHSVLSGISIRCQGVSCQGAA